MFSLKVVSSLLDVWILHTFNYNLNGFINEKCSICKTPFVDSAYLGVKKTEVRDFRVTTCIPLLAHNFNRYIHNGSVISSQNREFYTLFY